jgi:hypothetical protein
MLKEYFVSQRTAEPKRRWFGDEFFDLIVWLDDDGSLRGFQLVQSRRALSWTREAGYSHDGVDKGEAVPTKNLTPILIGDGVFHGDEVLQRLADATADLDQPIRDFVVGKVRSYNEETHG